MRSVRTKRLLAALAVALITSGGVAAIALANITPANHKVYVSSTNSKLTVGTVSVECQYAVASGTTTTPASKEFGIGAPLFENAGSKACSTSLGASVTATVTTSGTWKIQEISATEADIEVPAKGAVISIPAAPCTITVAPTATKVKATTWTNGVKKSPLAEPSTAEFSKVKVPISTSGAGCPSATEAEFSGFFVVADITNLEEPIII